MARSGVARAGLEDTRRGVTTQEAGNSSLDDEGQLRFATAQGRVLLSYNKRHFAKLHYDWMAAGGVTPE